MSEHSRWLRILLPIRNRAAPLVTGLYANSQQSLASSPTPPRSCPSRAQASSPCSYQKRSPLRIEASWREGKLKKQLIEFHFRNEANFFCAFRLTEAVSLLSSTRLRRNLKSATPCGSRFCPQVVAAQRLFSNFALRAIIYLAHVGF